MTPPAGQEPMRQWLARTRYVIGANPSLMALKRATIGVIAGDCSVPSLPGPLYGPSM